MYLLGVLLITGDISIFIAVNASEYRAVVVDFNDLFAEFKFGSVQHGVLGFVKAGVGAGAPGVKGHVPGAVADHRSGYVHGRVAHADYGHRVPQLVGVRVSKVVDGEVHVPQGFSLYAQLLGPPHAGADENALVAVPEQVLDLQGSADGGVGADLDAHGAQLFLVALQDGLGQTKFRDSVLEHAADLVPGVENGHAVALLGQKDGDGDARRPCADHGDLFPVFRSAVDVDALETGVGYIVFNAAHMDGLAFAA